jgi:hypothetical protein
MRRYLSTVFALSVLLLISLVRPSSASASILFQDQFNGSGELHSYDSDYQVIPNYGPGTMTVNTDRVEVTDGDSGYLYTGLSQSDVCASVDFLMTNNDWGWVAIFLRGTDPVWQHMDQLAVTSGSGWHFDRVDGQSFYGEVVFDRNTPHTLKGCVSGTTVTGYIDGVQFMTAQTNTTGGYVGLAEQYRMAYLDNFKIETNTPPTANANGPYSVNEGGTVTLNGTGTDSDNDPLSYAWDLDNNGTFETSGQSPSFSAVAKDGPSSPTVVLRVCDTSNDCDTDNATVNITNVAPTVNPITTSANPVTINTSFNATATFNDPAGSLDSTYNATWNWGDGSPETVSATWSGSSGTASRSHTYANPGVYTITVQIQDKDGGNSNTSTFEYESVYDPQPNTHFGAARLYTDPSTNGQAQFGVSARYSGSNAVGNVSLKVNAATVNFVSTSISSLVVANNKATLRGTGTLNGTSGYTFLVTGLDGSGGNGKIRFQIKDSGGNIAYDTQPGASDVTNPTTTVTGAVNVQ